MVAPRSRRLRAKTVAQLHRDWLDLVEPDGPFLAVAPLKRVWPQGMPSPDADKLDILREAKVAFDHAWEAADFDPDDESAAQKYCEVRDDWVRTVLRDAVGWGNLLKWGSEHAPGIKASSPNRTVHTTPDAVLAGPDVIGALVSVVERATGKDGLKENGTDGWAASPIGRMEELLRASGIPIGIVTDGRWWALVCSRPGVMAASGVVDALTWTEEPLTRNAFLTLIQRQYLVGGDPNERLPKLFEDSVAAAEEITEALGVQVRRAVELLIQSFAESAAEARRHGRPDHLPVNELDSNDAGEVYAAAVTVMMRVVFLLYAEERGLLPTNDLWRQGYGISGELDGLEERELIEGVESLDSTFLTWHRLLATSQAIHGGASYEDIRMIAYGGSLFDPARYRFLTATNDTGKLALPVSDRVMLQVLRAVQKAQIRGDEQARRISFRDIDVEQIGYIYEGLLGYTCVRVRETQLGLVGQAGNEPEIPLVRLEDLASRNRTPDALAKAIIAWVETDQPSASSVSANALARWIGAGPAEDADRALRAATLNDDALRERLLRWERIIRRDLRNRPTVFLAGGLLVKETPSRKNAGAHYTPKDLAENVVHHALEPLVYKPGPHQTADSSEWRIVSPEDILNLKIADIACGSGAFLVAAARYLADRLIESWSAHGRRVTDPDPRLHAIREVIARCLYGADINAMALEMCKLSLWLVSLDPALPFSFVDDKILHGNSLLGITDLKQLRYLHIDPKPNSQPILTTAVDIDPRIQQAIDLRRELANEVRAGDPQRDTHAKESQLKRLRDLTAELRNMADGVIAAGLRLGGKSGRALDEAYNLLAEMTAAAFKTGAAATDREAFDDLLALGLTPEVPTDYWRWQPLHWAIEVPDVMDQRGGFDAVIGNPPFLAGRKIGEASGRNMRDWSVYQIANGQRGGADLVAYFFLRASRLLRRGGVLGLIATNSVAQGASRQVGLDQMEAGGFTITRAVQSDEWPSASAAIEYAAVWATTAEVRTARFVAERARDDAATLTAPYITTLLEAAKRRESFPRNLSENAGIAFQGAIAFGMGFLLEPAEAAAWMANDPRNREVIFPYLNGDDLSSRFDMSASRYGIFFADRTEAESAEYVLPFERVRTTVRQERMRGSADVRAANWWQFWRPRLSLWTAARGMSHVIALSRVSKVVVPVRVPTGQVYSDRLVIFVTDSYGDQAVLSSSLHWSWAVKYSSTLESRVNYALSEAFETFPRPREVERLSDHGGLLDTERLQSMKRLGLGLTDLYNRVNDPSLSDSGDAAIARMRQIHAELDRAVVEAYGWSDVELGHGFHTYRKMTRWTISPEARVELMDRLLQENQRRAAEEARRAPVKRTRGRAAPATDDQPELEP